MFSSKLIISINLTLFVLQITFDCQQTYELLHYLEELNIEKKLKKDEKTEVNDEIE